MNLHDTLDANLELERGPLWGIGWADLADDRVAAPISWADRTADLEWATAIFSDYAVGPGDHCLVVSDGRNYWPRQVEGAVTALGGFVGNINTASYEVRRLSVYLRYLTPKILVGLTIKLAEAIGQDEALVALMRQVPYVFAYPDAAAELRRVGITARAFGPIGPALALPCRHGDAAHVDGTQFTVRQHSDGRHIVVSTDPGRELQLTDAVVAATGQVRDRCSCTGSGPVVDLDS
ncbi:MULTISPECIES: hypothetical protein [Rhodococcus]|uniref:Uncharacterized protein n=1 Tax=Rhodococcus oxybenzonivorans TaxID=1990687 RepID=A0AAE5A4V5_9NOCA|nr:MULTISPECIES: hypothetical protein [Rhodococcus]MDV7241630.1 hypothetical protein [Rhodococcus oxybenzonivorans]MDV7264215.1 hypothetical protein [Rhodococcus oxybenzonivorans]MDV7273837.1 hypothetical protein [Rhodococcus oxybenzonivorans]MDV7333911.1 hypothetical protein [Rhodococcus oxybenzonivorans]MDV7343330.1 hypothetical protein [Rhodococcus oxybenzonivorans]